MPNAVVQKIVSAGDFSAAPRWQNIVQILVATPLVFLAASQFLSTACTSVLPDFITDGLAAVAPFHIADRYGLFAVMTTKRPEVVFEGSRDGQSWRSYEFEFKPGDDLRRPPPWIEPHMPRLDWRL